MGDLHEIVDLAAMDRLFRLLAVASPVAGALIGGALASRRGRARRGAILGLVVGLIGTLNWLMWSVYNALTDRIGLDTVRNLEVNVVLFAAVGLVIGFGAARLRGRFVEAGRAASPEPHDEQQQSSSSERA